MEKNWSVKMKFNKILFTCDY